VSEAGRWAGGPGRQKGSQGGPRWEKEKGKCSRSAGDVGTRVYCSMMNEYNKGYRERNPYPTVDSRVLSSLFSLAHNTPLYIQVSYPICNDYC
jgi:hypothetical protein